MNNARNLAPPISHHTCDVHVGPTALPHNQRANRVVKQRSLLEAACFECSREGLMYMNMASCI